MGRPNSRNINHCARHADIWDVLHQRVIHIKTAHWSVHIKNSPRERLPLGGVLEHPDMMIFIHVLPFHISEISHQLPFHRINTLQLCM
jgi:uncharacterized protein YqjF (DUF2071 family)